MEEKKRKIWNLLTILVIAAVMTGIIYYAADRENKQKHGKGTLICIMEGENIGFK